MVPLPTNAAMKAIINTEVAVNKKRPHRLSLSRLSKIAVMVKSWFYLIIRDSQAHEFSNGKPKACYLTV
ncbi:hypothetical protein HanIR_Chr01g0050961 [Helianthus annuus]|nr:hypothetical protein HanIR_Chr01g0050961 [Helianthus annuus]